MMYPETDLWFSAAHSPPFSSVILNEYNDLRSPMKRGLIPLPKAISTYSYQLLIANSPPPIASKPVYPGAAANGSKSTPSMR